MNEILCHECGHSINKHLKHEAAKIYGECEHFEKVDDVNFSQCNCELTPQDIAAHALEQAAGLLKRANSLMLRSQRIIRSQSKTPHLIEGDLETLYWKIDEWLINSGLSHYEFISSKSMPADEPRKDW